MTRILLMTGIWLLAAPGGPGPTADGSMVAQGRAADARVNVIARDFAFDMPSDIPSGMVRFVFENRGREPHYLRLLRIDAGKTLADVAEWRKSRTPMPQWLRPAGGIGTIGPSITAEYVARVEAGRYIAICGHPSPDGTPHADKGMIREVNATGGGDPARPASDRELTLGDHTFSLTPPARAGRDTWRVLNAGSTTHQALLVRLPDGVSAEVELAWFRGGSKGSRPGVPVGGVIEIAAGAEAWITVQLQPGRYLLLCGVARSPTERHFDLGMSREFTIGG